MCGVHLIIDKKRQLDERPVRNMVKTSEHRGPDGEATQVIEAGTTQLFFGHNRLKIIDPSERAAQPFTDEFHGNLLSFNGEIYNYKALRKTLEEEGVSFVSHSDTEVLYHWLSLKGEEGLERLEGMFAFVFYDRKNNHVITARDSFGIKPVYYYEDHRFLIVSSELNSLLGSNLVPVNFNSNQLYHYLIYKYVSKPETFYKHVYELEEGKFLQYRPETGISHIQAFPSLNTSAATGPFSMERLEELLHDSVAKHLRADVPTGLFLSGGIDSTLLLALIREQGIQDFPVFTISSHGNSAHFKDQDAVFARKAADRYKAEYNEFRTDSSILEEIPSLSRSMDQPVGDGAYLLTYRLSEKVKEHVRVVLTGAGADEIFAGYNRHEAYYKYLKLLHKAPFILSLIKKTGAFFPEGKNIPFREQFRLFNKFARQLSTDPEETFANFSRVNWINDNFFADKSRNKTYSRYPMNKNAGPEHYFLKGLQNDLHTYLISDILAVTDKAAMAHGLEARTPYLDVPVKQFIDQQHAMDLMKYGKKWMLKSLLKQKGGKEFTDRRKTGFGMPLNSWLREKSGEAVVDLVRNKKNIIYEFVSFAEVDGLINDHLHKRKDASVEIFSLAVLCGWCENAFGS